MKRRCPGSQRRKTAERVEGESAPGSAFSYIRFVYSAFFVFRVCVVHERNRPNQAEWVVAEWNAWHPKENPRRVPRSNR